MANTTNFNSIAKSIMNQQGMDWTPHKVAEVKVSTTSTPKSSYRPRSRRKRKQMAMERIAEIQSKATGTKVTANNVADVLKKKKFKNKKNINTKKPIIGKKPTIPTVITKEKTNLDKLQEGMKKAKVNNMIKAAEDELRRKALESALEDYDNDLTDKQFRKKEFLTNMLTTEVDKNGNERMVDVNKELIEEVRNAIYNASNSEIDRLYEKLAMEAGYQEPKDFWKDFYEGEDIGIGVKNGAEKATSLLISVLDFLGKL